MLTRLLKAIATLAIALIFLIEIAIPPAFAGEQLPQPDPVFNGKIGTTHW